MTNCIYEGPRSMYPEEYDEFMDLAEKAYGYTRQHCLNYYPQTQRRHFTFENHFIVKQDGKVVSHAGLYPMVAIANGCEVEVGGIGDVATHPDYQGKGYMGKLLNHSVEKMKEREIPLSILWGDTQRYRRFGWEIAGRKMVFHLNQRSVKKVKMGKEVKLRGYRDKKDLERIMGIHEKELLRIKRSPEAYEGMLKSTRIQIWMGNQGNRWIYAILNDKKIIEFGGQPSLVTKFFHFILNYYPIGNIEVHLPCKDTVMLRSLYEISSGWEIVPLGMIKIIDLRKTLLSFREQMQNKTEFHGIEKGNSVTLKMRDSSQKATLVVGEEIQVEDKEGPKAISLSDIEMVRLLFGLSPESFATDKEQEELLASLFPVGFYLWGLDHV